VAELRASIKNDIVRNKLVKAAAKENKENEKKQKIAAQIQAAQDKLARLQAKLA
jgi:hypothetical protein